MLALTGKVKTKQFKRSRNVFVLIKCDQVV